MPPRRQPHPTGTTASVPYRSIACWIGKHHACIEPSPPAVTDDVPVIYEECICPCHSAPDLSVSEQVVA